MAPARGAYPVLQASVPLLCVAVRSPAGIPSGVIHFKRTNQHPNRPAHAVSAVFAVSVVQSPERRCSSRTFRYGYLVTT